MTYMVPYRQSVRTAAMPLIVQWDVGGYTYIREYGERINAAWEAFLESDFEPWLGSVIEAAKATSKKPSDATLKYIRDVQDHHNQFLIQKEAVDKWLHWSKDDEPSLLWTGLETCDATLRRDRELFESVAGYKPKSDDPGNLQEPPSKEGGIPWTPILVVGGIVATAAVLGAVARFMPERLPSWTKAGAK